MTDRTRPFITDPAELGATLALPATMISAAAEPNRAAPFRVPRSLVRCMERGNENDPVLMQFWPRPEERESRSGFTEDPLCERTDSAEFAGRHLPDTVLRKYAGRVLVMTNGACAANCRFCFRRHFPKLPAPPWKEIAEYLENDPSVSELILSGGDPLGLTDAELETCFHYIRELSFVKRVRVHTRYPILVPGRITPHLCELFREFRTFGKKLSIVFHINHPAELCDETVQTLGRLAEIGVPLFSQTVLLAGINDDPDVLVRLFEKEFDAGVIPYYLHQLDRVAGAAHFETPPEKGLAIFEQLRAALPGYLLPRYVREIPGASSKLPVAASSIKRADG